MNPKAFEYFSRRFSHKPDAIKRLQTIIDFCDDNGINIIQRKHNSFRLRRNGKFVEYHPTTNKWFIPGVGYRGDLNEDTEIDILEFL